MTPWSSGLIRHVIDRKDEGSNLGAAKNLFQFKSTKISLWKSAQKKKGKLSLKKKIFFFNVGPPKEDIISDHLLWSINQFNCYICYKLFHRADV